MISLRKILTEGVNEKRFADIFVYAFKSIMDVDDEQIRVESISARKNPTAYMHWGYNLKVKLLYRNKKYYIPITFFYYKFPPEELSGLERDKWDDMLKQSERFPEQDLDEKFLLKPNKLFKFVGGVIEGEGYFDGDRIGDFEGHSILDAVTQIKKVIDGHDSEPSPEKETPPMPVSSKDLVGTYQ